MRFISRSGITLAAFCLCIVLFPTVSRANHAEEVLGESVNLSEIDFPGLAAGPGFILPDSSLYPLDEFVQEVRLLLAFTPEQEAVVHMRIAGEGMAETKVMMDRNNSAGIQTALSRVEREVTSAAKALSDAAAKGRENTDLARSMNLALSEYRDALSSVSAQAPSALALKLAAANEVVLMAKVAVEDQLPSDELALAVANDLKDEIDTDVLGVQTAADELQQKMQQELPASESAMSNDLIEERVQLLSQMKTLLQSLQENQKAMRALQGAQNSLNFNPTVIPTQ